MQCPILYKKIQNPKSYLNAGLYQFYNPGNSDQMAFHLLRKEAPSRGKGRKERIVFEVQTLFLFELRTHDIYSFYKPTATLPRPGIESRSK